MFSKTYTEYAKGLCNSYFAADKSNNVLYNLFLSIQCISMLYR